MSKPTSTPFSFFTPAAKRAFEIADMLRAAGRKVVAGGIFPTMMPDEAAKHFDAVIVGEGEPVWGQVLSDFQKRELKPRYQATEPFCLDTLPPPRLDLYVNAEDPVRHPDDYPLQNSRGCPLNCDACVLPTVMTKKLRPVPLKQMKQSLADLRKYGKRACITEDTTFFFFSGARKHFRDFLNDLREDPRPGYDKISYIGISMPMILNIDLGLLEDLKSAGVDRFYLVCGFDPVTRKAFGEGDPKAMSNAVACITKCLDYGIEPYTSLLVGNETDDEKVFDRTLEFTEKAKVPKTEFAIFTPYPGTPSWHALKAQNRIFDFDWSHYNDANAVFKPKQFSPERLVEGYLFLWREFYKNKMSLKDEKHALRTIQF
ncbi:MAG: hypothetical protein QM765_00835 [Myxococcales bacterium]